ncbi:sulfotransferase [Roseospira visakhapatnamensis]|uniref:Sulfotransferase family protein n=1 Tax=Roseospira visakhapatnamensis TaxID=390880 RepID=A0A7W6W9T0_9PROT|nr:sulfotransferase [Roseospira visakhapatnamensis]MBB4266450.1 hypothetical protein [Roseospira visakhapatnamensis]
MGSLVGDSLTRYGALLRAAAAPPPGRRRPTAYRLLVMAAFVPLFTLGMLLHILALLLDEALFPGYRRVEIRAPLVILGVPRSGTTALHRVLARDPGLTTFSTWECLFAPSIIQRKAVLALARLDRAVGHPLGRVLGWLQDRVFGALDDVHAMDLAAPEEDYLALLPILACFILVVPFPRAEALWRLGRVDRDMPDGERRRLIAFYRRILQRHLYVHGAHKRLLSKNAAFAGMAGTLLETFPDARVICCLRDPLAVVPSQVSAVQGGVALFGGDPEGVVFRARMPELLAGYYETLLRVLPPPAAAERHVILDMAAIKTELSRSVRHAYDILGLPVHPDLDATLEAETARSRAWRSAHRYTASDLGLDEADLRRRFAGVHAAYPFGRATSPDRPSEAPGHAADREAPTGRPPGPPVLAGSQGR